ncbi:MAG TPA: hypothetical protein VNL71_15620 [Chloroflexota bacterium]|nr:hypothetical protein [Chloroflexota bacterium]
MDERDLMDAQVRVLFHLDAAGHLLSANEAEEQAPPAPRFFLVRMRGGNVWLSRHDLPAGVLREVDRLSRREPVAADFSGVRPATYEAIWAVLQANAPIITEYFGASYVFPDGLRPPRGVTAVSQANASVLQGPMERFVARLRADQPCWAIVEDGVALSVAYTWRWTVGAAAVGVYTLEGYRGRGYAVAVAAAWGCAMRRAGRLALYGHEWDNAA